MFNIFNVRKVVKQILWKNMIKYYYLDEYIEIIPIHLSVHNSAKAIELTSQHLV
jgi:hypothetical protein